MNIPVVGILRGFAPKLLPEIVRAVQRGGLQWLEITMNSPAAAEQIREACRLAEGNLQVGAGTVTTERLLDEALAAGASFIVTPTLNQGVLRRCVELKVPIYPGVLSPTEACTAWELGATMVKVFPAEVSLIRALRGPFPEIKLMPTGGVDLYSIPDFIKAGANALGVGSPLFAKERVETRDWTWLESRARAFVTAGEIR